MYVSLMKIILAIMSVLYVYMCIRYSFRWSIVDISGYSTWKKDVLELEEYEYITWIQFTEEEYNRILSKYDKLEGEYQYLLRYVNSKENIGKLKIREVIKFPFKEFDDPRSTTTTIFTKYY